MSYTVLIVDDSATTRAWIRRTIDVSGLKVDRVLEARDGFEASAMARSENINLILTDLNMPVMDGTQLVREVMANNLTKHIPVIVISADPNPEHAAQLMKLGVRGFLRKPFTPESLRNTLESLVEGHAHV